MSDRSSEGSTTGIYVALGCGGLLLLVIGALVVGLSIARDYAKETVVYQKASEAVRSSAEVQAELSTPIESEGPTGGQYRTVNGSGYANFQFPVSGPSGDGSAAVRATQTSGRWRIEQLQVHVDGQVEPITIDTRQTGQQGGVQAEAAPGPQAELTAIATGAAHICGLDVDGRVICWGDDNDNKLMAPPGEFEKLSAGMDHTCGVDTSGRLHCWGDDKFGQIAVPDGGFVDVSAGFTHTCAIDDAGAVACWDAGDTNGAEMFDEGQADAPEGTFTAVAAGSFHTCAIDDAKHIHCWGDDDTGESSPPAGAFEDLALGADHGCALSTDGSVACWGDDDHGQATPPSGEFVQLAAGEHHNCALADDGALTCWGDNEHGQTDAPDDAFAFVAGQAAATCAVDEQGDWQCWGDDKANHVDNSDEDELYKGPSARPEGEQRPRARSTGEPPPVFGAGDVRDVSTIEAASIIRQHAGKPRLVVIWRTTCPPCRKMFPEVREFAVTCHQMGIQPLVFSTDQSRQNMKRYLSQGPVPFEPYRIERWQRGEFDANLGRAGLDIGDSFGTPLVAVLDTNGNRVGQHEGSTGIQRARGWVRELER